MVTHSSYMNSAFFIVVHVSRSIVTCHIQWLLSLIFFTFNP